MHYSSSSRRSFAPISWIVVAALAAATPPLAAQSSSDTVASDSAADRPGAVAAPAGALRADDRCHLGKKRALAQGAAAAAFVGGNLELFRRFKNAWWSGEKSDRFFFNADWGQEFRDQDKFGHLYGGYHLMRAGHTVLRGTCVSQKKAVLYSAIYATAFQLQIEIWDGQYAKYGFSYPDLLANTVGMGLGVLHALKPRTRVVKPTISYRQTPAMREAQGWDEIRHSTDYSGQTYWLSTDVDAVLPGRMKPYWPALIRFSVGHSITDYVLVRPAGSPSGTPQEVVRGRRRILLSLDLDAGKLPDGPPWWNLVKDQLSYIRLPAPALQLTPKFEGIGWYR